MRRPQPSRLPCLRPARIAAAVALAAIAAFAVTLSGCRGPAAGQASASAADLEIRAPRAILFPSSGVVYLTVVNSGPRSDRLVRVETPAAQAAETHESVAGADGVMRMVAHPDGFEVPAGGSLELAPGGKHVMLVGPRQSAAAGSTIHLILHFERAGAVEVDAAVEAPGKDLS
jgi:copper(I)-binding protein